MCSPLQSLKSSGRIAPSFTRAAAMSRPYNGKERREVRASASGLIVLGGYGLGCGFLWLPEVGIGFDVFVRWIAHFCAVHEQLVAGGFDRCGLEFTEPTQAVFA